MLKLWSILFGGVNICFLNFLVLLVGSIGASIPNFSLLEGVILTIPGGVGWGGLIVYE